MAGNATLRSDLRLGRAEVLRSLRHYLWAQGRQGHQTNDHLEERGVERGSARRSSLKGWERANINQTNIGTVSKATLGKLLRDAVERNMRLFQAHRCHLELESPGICFHAYVQLDDIRRSFSRQQLLRKNQVISTLFRKLN